ncbi:MAG TPA: hypothetical protein VFL76_00870 [Edaphocola sp.]|nr:hypothetical protein [Edaphocola sp.]
MLRQLKNARLTVTMPATGDFYIEDADVYIEAGGGSKDTRQVKEQQKYLVAADDIETGRGPKVPLWLFGFLY